MRFFPSQRLTLESMDPPERVSERLASLVAPKEPWCILPPTFPFTGKVDELRFELACLKWLERAGRAPVVTGDIAPRSGGSEIRASVELRPFAAIGLAAFLALGTPVGLVMAFAPGETNDQGLFLAAFPPLAYGLNWLSVRRHAKRFRKVAEERLGCRLAGPPGAPASDGFGSTPPESGWSRPAR